MNIYCKHCGEPWDLYELHEVADATGNYENLRPFAEARALFYIHGCGVFQNFPPSNCTAAPIVPRESLAAVDALQDLLGDDVDGLASMLEDARYMGDLEL